MISPIHRQWYHKRANHLQLVTKFNPKSRLNNPPQTKKSLKPNNPKLPNQQSNPFLHNRRKHSKCNRNTKCNSKTVNHKSKKSINSTLINKSNNLNPNRWSNRDSLSHKIGCRHLLTMTINWHSRFRKLGI